MRSLPLLLLAGAAACGSTGSAIVAFHAAAAGPADSVAGAPYAFTNGPGYQVSLTKATLHVGALYLNRQNPTSGTGAQGCVLPGIYSGQVTVPLTVDVLSPVPQAFPADGEGTADPVHTGEVWLFGIDPFESSDPTVIVEVEGTATQGATALPFSGRITISDNRIVPPGNPAQPGANPLCKQRIVTPIRIDLTLAQGGTLLLRVDPKVWFANVDFAQVPVDPSDPARRKFLDDSSDDPDRKLYAGIRSTAAYTFNWQAP